MNETDRGKDFSDKILTCLLNGNNDKRYSRNISLGAVFAGRSNRAIRDLLKKVGFERSDGNRIDLLPILTKQYKNRKQFSIKLTPIQASFKKNEG